MLFLFFRVIFYSFFKIPVVTENAKLKLALAITIGARITVANEARDIPPLVAEKTIRVLSN